jgi:hypothetical protein
MAGLTHVKAGQYGAASLVINSAGNGRWPNPVWGRTTQRTLRFSAACLNRFLKEGRSSMSPGGIALLAAAIVSFAVLGAIVIWLLVKIENNHHRH